MMVPEPDLPLGKLQSRTGELRQVACRACGEFRWTKAKRHEGRCSPCRYARKPCVIRAVREFLCRWCGLIGETDSRFPKQFHAKCWDEKELARGRRDYQRRTGRV